MTSPRRPVSVLVVVHTDDKALLLRRKAPFDFWQSVTGSLQDGESHADAAQRELFEETGFRNEGELIFTGISRQFTIDTRWRGRFAAGIVENVEFEWRYRLPATTTVQLNASEHSESEWLPIAAAIGQVWSWTNRDALRSLQR